MHPYGGLELNLDKAREWCAFLSAQFNALFTAPWIPLCKHWPNNGVSLEHGMRLDCAAIKRLDSCFAVGGRFSPGMQHERGFAESNGKLVYDASRFETPNQLLADVDAMNAIESIYGKGPMR
jgi:hypothetical protein